MVLVGMILITSQTPLAFAGFCSSGSGDDNDDDGYCGNQGDCDDTNAAVNPSAPELDNGIDDNCDGVIDEGFDEEPTPDEDPNPVEVIENLMVDVEELIEDENFDINDGQTTSILTKLQKAVDKVESDSIKAAVGSLKAFINQINAFINAGSILPEDGQTLIDGAQSIIDMLLA